MADQNTLKELLRQVTDLWTQQIQLCEKRKAKDFGDAAKEIMRFVGQRFNPRRMGLLVDGLPVTPDMQEEYLTTLNWTALFVRLMTPYVYAQVPNRLASPAERPQFPPELAAMPPGALPNMPSGAEILQMQQSKDFLNRMICFEIQWALNWSPKVYDAKHNGRMAVQEGLSKGGGVKWLEMDDSPVISPDGTPYPMPVVRTDDIDNFGIDGDAKSLREAGYIYRRRWLPAYRVAKDWGEDVDAIRAAGRVAGGMQTQTNQALFNISPPSSDPLTTDLVCVYEFWSLIGLGNNLFTSNAQVEDFAEAMEQIGPQVHFAIIAGLDRPLGLDPDKLTAAASQAGGAVDEKEASEKQEGNETQPAGNLADPALVAVLRAALEWPIKTYGNRSLPWPCRMLGLEPRTDSPWPRAVLEAALPMQRFLDAIYTHMITRVKRAGRDVGGYDPAIGEEFIEAIRSSDDLRLAPIAGPVKEAVEKMIYFLKFPEMNKDIFQVLNIMWEGFREMTGITPEIQGGIPKTQDRSAKASSMRESGLSRRPDDYAEAVESFESDCSSLEAIAWRLHADPNLVAAIFGEKLEPIATGDGQMVPNWINAPMTAFWMQAVHTDDEYKAASEIEYEIEAGSGKRKNKQLLQQNARELWQMYGQQCFAFLLNYGLSKPLEILARMIAEAFDMPMEPLLQAFTEAAMQTVAMQQGQPQQPGAGGQAAPSGGAAGQVDGRWNRAAAGPTPPKVQTTSEFASAE